MTACASTLSGAHDTEDRLAYSFFTANDPDLYTGSEVFSSRINAHYELYGIPQEAALEYAALNAAWRAAYEAIRDPKSRTTVKIAAKNEARQRVRAAAARLAKRIAGNPNVTPAMMRELGLNVRAAPSPMPLPGKPEGFRLALHDDGAIELRWKCKHPRRAAGAVYHIFRRDALDQPFAYLGTTGKRVFVDTSLPPGVTSVTYRIRAFRTTGMGQPADFPVNFGSRSARTTFNFLPSTRSQAA